MLTRKSFLGGLGAAGLAALALPLAGCDSSDETDASDDSSSDAEATTSEAITIRIGEQVAVGGLSFSWLIEQGVFDSIFEGYDVTFETNEFASGPAANEAFAGSQLDFAEMGILPAFSGSSSGYGYKILTAAKVTEYAGSLVATASSGITSIEELAGKTIGTYIGGSWHYDTVLYLQSAGLTLDDVDLLNTAAETASGIRTESLDAGVLGPAPAAELVSEGSAVIISEQTGQPGFTVLVGTTEFTEAHPEVAQLMLQAYDAGLRYMDENVDDYLAYLEEAFGDDTDSKKATWDRYDYSAQAFGERVLNAASGMFVWMQENDYVDSDADAEDFIDTELAVAAGLETSI